ncbi:MAG: hypothetical protein QG656_201, partial [Candidatus Hydrogenedentes bacterium]|nr:hypothetical protein [Candidatus Hydrogenedentota bacterium]
LDCSLGPPFPFARLSLWLAPFKVENLGRAMMWSCLPLGMLAGFGVDAVAERWRSRKLYLGHMIFLSITGVWILKILERGIEPHPFLTISNAVVWIPAILMAITVLAGLGRPWAGGETRPRIAAGTLFRWAMPVLLLAELFVWNREYVPYLVNRFGFRLEADNLRQPHALWNGNSRLSYRKPNKHMLALEAAINGYDPLYIARAHHVLCDPPQYVPILSQTSVNADNQRGNLFLKRAFWLSRQYVAGPLPDKEALFPAATTVFLEDAPDDLPVPRVDRKALPDSGVSDRVRRITLGGEDFLRQANARLSNWEGEIKITLPEFDTGGLHAVVEVSYTSEARATVNSEFRGEQVFQRAELGKTVEVSPTDGQADSFQIPVPELSPVRATLTVSRQRESAMVLTDLAVLVDEADENALVAIRERRANSVTVDAGPLDEARILTFIDADYPGWRAYLDGQTVPIYRANDAFKAVLVPPGTHRIRFVFVPRSVYWGLIVSLAAFTGFAGILWVGRAKHQPAPDPAPVTPAA